MSKEIFGKVFYGEHVTIATGTKQNVITNWVSRGHAKPLKKGAGYESKTSWNFCRVVDVRIMSKLTKQGLGIKSTAYIVNHYRIQLSVDEAVARFKKYITDKNNDRQRTLISSPIKPEPHYISVVLDNKGKVMVFEYKNDSSRDEVFKSLANYEEFITVNLSKIVEEVFKHYQQPDFFWHIGTHLCTIGVRMDESEFLKRDEVATLFKVPRATIDYLISTGQLPFSRIGKRSVRFYQQAIIEWALKDRGGVEYRLSKKTNKST